MTKLHTSLNRTLVMVLAIVIALSMMLGMTAKQALAQDAETTNIQECVAIFGDQTANVDQDSGDDNAQAIIDLQAQIAALQVELDAALEVVAALQAVADLEAEIADLQADLDALLAITDPTDDQTADITELQDQIAALQTELDAAIAVVAGLDTDLDLDAALAVVAELEAQIAALQVQLDALLDSDNGEGNVANLNQQQIFECNQIIQNITQAGGVIDPGSGEVTYPDPGTAPDPGTTPDPGTPDDDDNGATGGDASTLNLQECIAIFGDQTADVDQTGDGNVANVDQQQAIQCNQLIENVTQGGSVGAPGTDDGSTGDDGSAGGDGSTEGTSGGDASSGAVGGTYVPGTEGGTDGTSGGSVGGDSYGTAGASGGSADSGVAGGGLALLPDTGGLSLILLGAGALLVGTGLLARRFTR